LRHLLATPAAPVDDQNGRVEKISVALTPEMAGMLRGGVASASELMRGALREWKARRLERHETLAGLL